MLSEDPIRQALHASRVVPLAVAKLHGPLGLEQLAVAVSRINPALGPGSAHAPAGLPGSGDVGKIRALPEFPWLATRCCEVRCDRRVGTHASRA
jgi:hypothetical protein